MTTISGDRTDRSAETGGTKRGDRQLGDRGIDRRAFLARSASAGGAVVLGGTVGSILTGCSSSPSSVVGASAPVRGGSLAIGTTAEIDGFYPASNHWDTNGLLYANAVYDPLMAVAVDGSIRPYLARSLTPNASYDQWTLTLRPGVRFHDGSPLTSEVVKANFDALKTSSLTNGPLAQVGSITTPDTTTVVFTLVRTGTAFPAALTTQIGYMVSQSMIERAGADPAAPNAPVGTGPYVYAQWQPNDHFTVARNPHYWRTGLPYLDLVTFRPIVDTAQREAALRTGSVDLIISIDPRTYDHFHGQPGYQSLVETSPVIGEPTMGFLLLNCAVAPTKDVRIRRALAMATDQLAIQRLFGNASVQACNGLFLPGSPYYSETGYPAHDPGQAAALIREYTSQHRAPSIQLNSTTDPRIIQLAQVVQQMWSQAGADVTIATVQEADIISNLLVGNFEAVPSAQFGAVNPDLNYPWLSTTTVTPVGSIGLNFARNDDPAIEAALRTAGSTLDRSTRVAAFRTVNERLAQDLPYIWIGRDLFPLAADSRVQGISYLALPDGSAGYAYNEGVFFPTQLWLGNG
jgi:peptide/nickel transport system substrate-binding protein